MAIMWAVQPVPDMAAEQARAPVVPGRLAVVGVAFWVRIKLAFTDHSSPIITGLETATGLGPGTILLFLSGAFSPHFVLNLVISSWAYARRE